MCRANKDKSCILLVGLIGMLICIPIGRFGAPLDIETYGSLVALGLLGIASAWFGLKSCCVLVLAIASCIAVPEMFSYFPVVECWRLSDVGRGGTGVEIPPFLRFGQQGLNGLLLDRYLGRVPSRWIRQSPLNPHTLDGNERVQSRALICSEYLEDTLAKLPSLAARKQVLACIVDPDNVLRSHQELLLTAIRDLGFPKGYDSELWWQEHEWFFHPVDNPRRGASVVAGWEEPLRNLDSFASLQVRRAIQTCRYQEAGQWGGDPEFGDAIQEFRFKGLIAQERRIAWWP